MFYVPSADGLAEGNPKFLSGVGYAVYYSVNRLGLGLALLSLVVANMAVPDNLVTLGAFDVPVLDALAWRSPSIVWVFAMHGAKMLGQVARLAAVFTVWALAPLILSHLNDKAFILKPVIN